MFFVVDDPDLFVACLSFGHRASGDSTIATGPLSPNPKKASRKDAKDAGGGICIWQPATGQLATSDLQLVWPNWFAIQGLSRQPPSRPVAHGRPYRR
jgi:hypothetical protein